MKKLFNALTSFRFELQMEAEKRKPKRISLFLPTFGMIIDQEPKPKQKRYYLQERLARLQRLSQLARSDNNLFKARQADRLIEAVNKRLSANGQLLMAHIEQKQVIN